MRPDRPRQAALIGLQAQLDGPVALQRDNPRNLVHIVVFAAQPEHRHDTLSGFPGKPVGQPDGGKRLQNGIDRPRKQTHLLAGNHRRGIRLPQRFDAGARRFPVSPCRMLPQQRIGQRIPVPFECGGPLDRACPFFGAAPVAREIVRKGLVVRAVIPEKRRKPVQVGKRNTLYGRLHIGGRKMGTA